MGRVLPSHAEYGGAGLTAYLEFASTLVDLEEIGLHGHARHLEICKKNLEFGVDALQELEEAEASSYEEMMALKERIAFFICGDVFLEAATWIQQNPTFEIAKRFGAFHEQPYSATFMRSTISAYNEDSPWKSPRITLIDDENKDPVLHASALQLRAWRTFGDPPTPSMGKRMLETRSNDPKTHGDRMWDAGTEEMFSLTNTKNLEEVFGVEAHELLSLLEAKIAGPTVGSEMGRAF